MLALVAQMSAQLAKAQRPSLAHLPQLVEAVVVKVSRPLDKVPS